MIEACASGGLGFRKLKFLSRSIRVNSVYGSESSDQFDARLLLLGIAFEAIFVTGSRSAFRKILLLRVPMSIICDFCGSMLRNPSLRRRIALVAATFAVGILMIEFYAGPCS